MILNKYFVFENKTKHILVELSMTRQVCYADIADTLHFVNQFLNHTFLSDIGYWDNEDLRFHGEGKNNEMNEYILSYKVCERLGAIKCDAFYVK